jgi:hypothetical protein
VSPVDAEPVPHEGRVVLDFQEGSFMLIDTVAVERRPLPKDADWELCFDDEGSGVVFDVSGSIDSILVDDVFGYQLWKSSDATLWCLTAAKGSSPRSLWASFSDKLKKHTCLDVTIPTLGSGLLCLGHLG